MQHFDQVVSYIEFTGIDAAGVATTKPQKMTDADQLVSSSIGNMQKAIDNLSLQRAYVGGQLSKAATQIDVVGARKLAVDRDVSRFGRRRPSCADNRLASSVDKS